MNLEKQVTSLELSMKLKELGIEQKSLFYWEWANDNAHAVRWFPYCVAPRDSGNFKHFSAFTASELGEMLPHRLYPQSASGSDACLDICKNHENYWMVAYYTDFRVPPRITVIQETEVDARAKMLIDLIENKFIEIKP